MEAEDIPLVRKSMVVELNNKQLSPHPACVTEAETYYMVDHITKIFVGRAISVDGDNITFKFPHPALSDKLTWPGRNDIEGRKEGNVLFNDALNTFYLQLYGDTHMEKDHSDSESENTLPPHGLLFPINSKGYFICTIPQKG